MSNLYGIFKGSRRNLGGPCRESLRNLSGIAPESPGKVDGVAEEPLDGVSRELLRTALGIRQEVRRNLGEILVFF